MSRHLPSRPSRHVLVAGLLSGAACLSPSLSTAQPGTVTVGDLATVCPGADDALKDALASAWRRVGFPSTVAVQLRVEDRRVEVTQVSGGMVPYRHAVARAAGRLACDSVGSGTRVVFFNVRFVGPDAPEAPPQLASR